MPQVNVIRWRQGAGWIILSGGGPTQSINIVDIETQALSKIRLGEPVAYIWAAGDADSADEHLSALDDMGAPTGYLVDILTEDDDTIRSQLSEAGMVVLGDGPSPEALRSGLPGAAVEGLQAAYDNGAVILGIGVGAEALGEVISSPAGEKNGLNWVEGAIILSHYNGDEDADQLRLMLESHPDSYGLGIGDESALALGPEGEVGAWGARRVTVTLGRSYGT